MSKEAEIALKNANDKYERKIEKIENQITAHLREMLANTPNTSEMLKIFS
jgi:hypothetical protein